MLYVDLSLSKIKEKLVAYGLKRTTSKRFIRYEGNYNNSCVKIGVEISRYHNIFELLLYVYDCVNYSAILHDLENDLERVFKDNLIANE